MTTPDTMIYLDSAATSWPKPDGVLAAVDSALRAGGSPGRGAHAMALAASRLVTTSRQRIASFLGVNDPRNLFFQPGCTQAANLVLAGALNPGDTVLVAAAEHNSITRPLSRLARQGVSVHTIPVDDWGIVHVDALEAMIAKTPVTAIVCQQASNVTGVLQPVSDIADLAREHGARMIVDGAQAAGHIPVNLGTLGADAWFCSGHKALLGPQGVGLLYLAPDYDVRELVVGGTGSGGPDELTDERERPSCHEAGTAPVPAIAGLAAGVAVLQAQGEAMRAHEAELALRLHEGLLAIPSVHVLGPPPGVPRVPIVAFSSTLVRSDRVAAELGSRWNIAVRAGLHCAPSAHAAVGTRDDGAVRFGLAASNTIEEVDIALEAVAAIIAGARS